MKTQSVYLLIAMATAAFAVGPLANARTAQQYSHEARVSLPQARVIALKAFPGKIVSEELEKEKGGSGLRYSFDIRKGKVVHEVGIDAITGKILENDVDHGGD